MANFPWVLLIGKEERFEGEAEHKQQKDFVHDQGQFAEDWRERPS